MDQFSLQSLQRADLVTLFLFHFLDDSLLFLYLFLECCCLGAFASIQDLFNGFTGLHLDRI